MKRRVLSVSRTNSLFSFVYSLLVLEIGARVRVKENYSGKIAHISGREGTIVGLERNGKTADTKTWKVSMFGDKKSTHNLKGSSLNLL